LTREDAAVGDMELAEDPGWRDAWVGLLWIPTVFFLKWRLRRTKLPTLLLLRGMWVMFAGALILIGCIRAALGTQEPSWSASSAVRAGLAIMAIGLAEQLVLWKWKVLEPPMACPEAGSPAGYYLTRFFLRVAFANVPFLFGFVLSFTTGRWWLILFGALPSLAGYAHAAPTRRAIEREQRDLWDRGCTGDLLTALLESR
jgi:hypothetical protein